MNVKFDVIANGEILVCNASSLGEAMTYCFNNVERFSALEIVTTNVRGPGTFCFQWPPGVSAQHYAKEILGINDAKRQAIKERQ